RSRREGCGRMNGNQPALDPQPVDPSQRGLLHGKPAEPCVLVLFGASGDLARRELLPSLFELHRKRLLPEPFAIIGVAPSDWSSQQFRDRMREPVLQSCPGDAADWNAFSALLDYVRGDAISPPDQDYGALARTIARVRSAAGIPDAVLFHL